MLKIIIIPAFILAGLAIYAVVEEAMEWKYGHRQTPDEIEAFKAAYQEWLDGDQRADDFYDRPWNRLRLWLANIIAP